MILLFFAEQGALPNTNNTYFVCSSADPDVLDVYCDGVLTGRWTSA